jgi:hypothetical protein
VKSDGPSPVSLDAVTVHRIDTRQWGAIVGLYLVRSLRHSSSRGAPMENSRFDTLVKVLASRQPRRAALPVLAALGLGLVDPPAGIAKKNNTNDKKMRLCVCTSADPASCGGQKKAKAKAQKTLRRTPCAYRGRCLPGVSGCAGSLVGPPGPQGPQGPGGPGGSGGPAGPAGPGLTCPAACSTCQTCDPVTGTCVVNPRENGEPGTDCATPNVCCSGTCCTGLPSGVRQCNAAGACASCAEACEATCGQCFSLAQGGTRCGDFVVSTCTTPCNSSADCPEDQPSCVESFTFRTTNETTLWTTACFLHPLPPGFRGFCSTIAPCIP